MSSITAPMPIYDALLLLATPQEHDIILAAGPREKLDAKLYFGDPTSTDGDAAFRLADRAYEAIKEVMGRLTRDASLRVTGIDTRELPPKRHKIEGEVLRSGHLVWSKSGPSESTLRLSWSAAPDVIVNLHVEPAERFSPLAVTSMAPPSGLVGAERKNDTKRLRRMQELMDSGMKRQTAARQVAAEIPDPHSSEEALVKRLTRKAGALGA